MHDEVRNRTGRRSSHAHIQAPVAVEHQILAPTLVRSQILSRLYQAVQRDEMTKKDADRQLDYLRGLRIRLLGDRVLQDVAWKVADQARLERHEKTCMPVGSGAVDDDLSASICEDEDWFDGNLGSIAGEPAESPPLPPRRLTVGSDRCAERVIPARPAPSLGEIRGHSGWREGPRFAPLRVTWPVSGLEVGGGAQ